MERYKNETSLNRYVWKTNNETGGAPTLSCSVIRTDPPMAISLRNVHCAFMRNQKFICSPTQKNFKTNGPKLCLNVRIKENIHRENVELSLRAKTNNQRFQRNPNTDKQK